MQCFNALWPSDTRDTVLETKAGPSVGDRQLGRTSNFLHISLQIDI